MVCLITATISITSSRGSDINHVTSTPTAGNQQTSDKDIAGI